MLGVADMSSCWIWGMQRCHIVRLGSNLGAESCNHEGPRVIAVVHAMRNAIDVIAAMSSLSDHAYSIAR